MKIVKSPFFRTSALILGTFLAFAPLASGEGEVIFSEDFEGCDIGENIAVSKANQWRPSGFSRGETPGQGLATEGRGENRSVIAITTPETGDGNGATTYNLTSHFPETSGTLRLSLDVFPERGGGQILVRPRSSDASATLAHIQFRGGREMSIRAYSTGAQGGKAGTPIGKFRFDRWYKVSITLHLEKATPTYDVEIIETANPANIIGVNGLECPTPANAAGNLLIGSIFDKKSRYGWDNIVVEKLATRK